jgi:hypothetical protein
VILDQIGRACWQGRHLAWAVPSVLHGHCHSVGEFEDNGKGITVIIRHGDPSLWAVRSDRARLGLEMGVACEALGEFHNDIVVLRSYLC